MKVLVIPEDPTLDQHILKPIVEAMFADLGRKARVVILREPHLRGVDEAMAPEVVRDIIANRSMFDLYLLLLDRDADPHRQAAVDALERAHPGKLFGCLAIEEVEVWMLALHRDALVDRWPEIRAERDPKERFATPFLVERRWNTGLGRGRAHAMRALPGQLRALLSLCPELAELRDRLRAQLAA